MNEILVTILDILIATLIGLVIKYAVPFIKAKIKEFWVNKAVRYAEQKIQGSKLGEDRKKEAINFLNQVGIVVDQVIDGLIEAAVNVMNEEKKKLETK